MRLARLRWHFSAISFLRLERRRLVWTDATANPAAEWIARQITEAFPWDEAPRYFIRERDTSYGAASPGGCKPWAFATGRSRHAHPGRTVMFERLIGSIRRECLDHVVLARRSPSAVPWGLSGSVAAAPLLVPATSGPLGEQSHSFLNNAIALLGRIRARNNRAHRQSEAVGHRLKQSICRQCESTH
jgi:hypothetical protein